MCGVGERDNYVDKRRPHDVTQVIPLMDKVPSVRGEKAGQDEDPTAFKGIAAMTRSLIAISSGNGVSNRSSRSGEPNMAPASGRRGGLSREPWLVQALRKDQDTNRTAGGKL